MLFVTQEKEIKLDENIQVLYFYTIGMPFHNKIVYLVSQMKKKYSHTSYLAIDVDYFISQCIRFSVTSVPTLLILKNGKELKRLEGSIKKKDFIAVCADICL